MLLIGAGGGFDIYSGVPIYHWLRSRGQRVTLANLSSSRLKHGLAEVAPGIAAVNADLPDRPEHFPELYLARWMQARGDSCPVYCFEASGVQRLLAHYRWLAREVEADALVLIDGGTDILLRGDEPGLGSPSEDVASLAAASLLQEVPNRLVCCLGFGLDAHHHVCHAYVLEAAAQLTASGGFLGAFSLLPQQAEFQALQHLVDEVTRTMPGRQSIIACSVVAAGQGHFGDHHVDARTRGSELFLSPLTSTVWSFEVDALARRCLYLARIVDTWQQAEVTFAIRQFRDSIEPRPWKQLPL